MHNCSVYGLHGGHVELYIHVKGYYFYRGFGIIPLCPKHSAQKSKMKSGVNDIRCFDGSNDKLVLFKEINEFVFLPYEIVEHLKFF